MEVEAEVVVKDHIAERPRKWKEKLALRWRCRWEGGRLAIASADLSPHVGVKVVRIMLEKVTMRRSGKECGVFLQTLRRSRSGKVEDVLRIELS